MNYAPPEPSCQSGSAHTGYIATSDLRTLINPGLATTQRSCLSYTQVFNFLSKLDFFILVRFTQASNLFFQKSAPNPFQLTPSPALAIIGLP
jgi:hypothetical protein